MIREITYNEIFDSQRHFRTVLDSMSRPGKINRFAPVPLTPPPSLSKAAAYVGFALLNADASFHAASLGNDAGDYLRVNTASNPIEIDRADFIYVDGAATGTEALIEQAKIGIPTYPETGATAVIQVSSIGKSSATGGLQLTLEGPGVETREIVFVTGLRAELLAMLKAKNVEFPLGVDAIIVSADDCILCLPRTTKVACANL
jgi:alpha-D-ribose 1-methylphosphonate 5-triphosphate synthase subunit PhnH